MSLVTQINALAAAIRDKLNTMTPRLTPAGGSTNFVLTKSSGSDYDYAWAKLQLSALNTTGVADATTLLRGDGTWMAISTIQPVWGNITGSISNQSDLAFALLNKQPIDAGLTSLAALPSTLGVIEQTGADTFAIRGIGVANAGDLLTRATGDARFAAGTHTHTMAGVSDISPTLYSFLSAVTLLDARTALGVEAGLATKEPTITAGDTTQYWRGDKSWQTLNKSAVGLANVDNTSDANKPISTATQSALDGKLAAAHAGTGGTAHANVVSGGAAGFMTGADKQKLDGVATGATANATDTFLRDRANHTGTQGANTVSFTQAALLGRTTASAGVSQEVTVGAGLALSAGSLVLSANIADISGLEDALDAKLNASLVTALGLTFLSKATAADMRAVLALGTAALASSSDFAPAIHTHAIADVTGLQTALDNKEGTISAGTTAQYWRGDKSWQTLDKAAVGLNNVDNTSDVNKPISTAQQTALDGKVSTSLLGANNGVATLGSDGKVPSSQIPALALTDVTVVNNQTEQLALTAQEGDVAIRTDDGKTYIHNGGSAGTMADWSEISAPGGVTSVNGYTGSVSLTKADIGLGNVDNTSDANKPISTATQNALNLKADLTGATFTGKINATAPTTSAAGLNVGYGVSPTTNALNGDIWATNLGLFTRYNGNNYQLAPVGGDTTYAFRSNNLSDLTNAGTARTNIGLGNVDNTSDANKPISTATQTALDLKLAASHAGTGGTAHANATTSVAGFMSATDKTKIDGIATGATANQTDAYLVNRTNHTGTQAATTITMAGPNKLLGRITTGSGATEEITLGSSLEFNAGSLRVASGYAGTLTLAMSQITGLSAALDAKLDDSLASSLGLQLLGAVTEEDARGYLNLGSAALNATADFAAAVHTHEISDINGLTSSLGNKQPIDSTLTGLSSLGTTAGVIEQTSADTFAIRAIGVAASTSLLTRGDGDTRYALASHSHAIADVTGLQTALDNKLDDSQAGAFGLSMLGTTTAAAGTALLNTFTSTLKGLVPASGGGSTAFLRADGVWAVPPGGGGGGEAAWGSITGLLSDQTDLQNELNAKQNLDATLTALAGLNSTAGLVEQTGADTFTKRAIGVASSTDILTRADGDARYAAIGGGSFQPLDADLTAIAGLAGTSGFLKKTAADTWSLDTSTYALSSHNHDSTYQPLDATLTAVAALDATAGVVEQTGADTFVKRPIGIANGTDLITRAQADTRYAPAGTTWAPVTATATGSSQNITLPESGLTTKDVIVIVDGVILLTSDYSIAGTTLTLNEITGAEIEVRKLNAAGAQGANWSPTTPVAADFSTVRYGLAGAPTIANVAHGSGVYMTFLRSLPGSSWRQQYLLKSVTAVPFRAEAKISNPWQTANNWHLQGLAISTNNAADVGKHVRVHTYVDGNGLGAYATKTTSIDGQEAALSGQLLGPIAALATEHWMAIEYDGTNINTYWSYDGYAWFKTASEPASFFTGTPNLVGFGNEGVGSDGLTHHMWCPHFHVTNNLSEPMGLNRKVAAKVDTDWAIVSTATCSASAQIDLPINAANYDEWMLEGFDIVPNGAIELALRFGTGSTPTYDTGANYDFRASWEYGTSGAGTASRAFVSGTSNIRLGTVAGATSPSGKPVRLTMMLDGLASGNSARVRHGLSDYDGSGGLTELHFNGIYNPTTEITALRIYTAANSDGTTASGNMTSGRWVLKGRRRG